ncbi:hypothetical protein HY991_04570 [Candidatus Micrarchaeota archaeon]|nr:hypothetical protein [Candidatus Micrarchaeota archaeon]
MTERAAQLFHGKVMNLHNAFLPRARGKPPKIEGSKVTIFGPQFLFRHDPKSPDRTKQIRAGVQQLAMKAVEEHGGDIKVTIKKAGKEPYLRMVVNFMKRP